MAVSKKAGKLKVFKIHYFVGDYFSSKGEREKIATIAAHSEDEAERQFYSIFRGCSLGWIEEVVKKGE